MNQSDTAAGAPPHLSGNMRRKIRLKRALGNETYSALALAAATIAALIWANIGTSYAAF